MTVSSEKERPSRGIARHSERLWVRPLVRAHAWVAVSIPSRGTCGRQQTDVSLSHRCLSLSPGVRIKRKGEASQRSTPSEKGHVKMEAGRNAWRRARKDSPLGGSVDLPAPGFLTPGLLNCDRTPVVLSPPVCGTLWWTAPGNNNTPQRPVLKAREMQRTAGAQ